MRFLALLVVIAIICIAVARHASTPLASADRAVAIPGEKSAATSLRQPIEHARAAVELTKKRDVEPGF